MIIKFEYCPILGLRWCEIREVEEYQTRRKKRRNGKNR